MPEPDGPQWKSPLVWDIDENLVDPSRPEIQSKNPKWEPAWRDWIDSRIRIGETFTSDEEAAERDWWDRTNEEEFADDPEGQEEFEADWADKSLGWRNLPVTESIPGYSDPANPAGWFKLRGAIDEHRVNIGQPPLSSAEDSRLRESLGIEDDGE